MKPILVIGATGNIGRQVAAQLTEAGTPVRGLSRNPEAVWRGDLTRPETLDASLDGVERVFLVWTAPMEAVAGAIERIAARARHVVFLSAPLKTRHPFFQQPNAGRTTAEMVERTIEASGLEWTHLRPHMFALDAIGFWAAQIRAGDVVRWPYLDVPTAPIDERDIAAVAVRALCEDGHAGKEYVLTGPESLTQREQIATIGEGLGRALRIEEMTPEEARRECLREWPPALIDVLLRAWGAAAGQPAHVTSTVAEILGRPARSFREWVEANVRCFAP